MIKNLFIFLSCTLLSLNSWSQYQVQYFDGNDTIAANSLIMKIDTASAHTWQIGKPQKTKFTSAATYPNAIITILLTPIEQTTHLISLFRCNIRCGDRA